MQKATKRAKETKKKARFYPKKSLIPNPVVEGARMWSVALKRAQLTYFEVDPESRFDWHSHRSEQITMVLRGALFFEVKERIICVKEGEVIAIPSNLPHAAFTKENPVIAIDAWSPVVVKYKSRNKHSCVMETERILASGFGMKA